MVNATDLVKDAPVSTQQLTSLLASLLDLNSRVTGLEGACKSRGTNLSAPGSSALPLPRSSSKQALAYDLPPQPQYDAPSVVVECPKTPELAPTNILLPPTMLF